MNWQGRQGSNLRQPVLETGTLPAELHPYSEPCVVAVPAVSSISTARFAREKRLPPTRTAVSDPPRSKSPRLPPMALCRKRLGDDAIVEILRDCLSETASGARRVVVERANLRRVFYLSLVVLISIRKSGVRSWSVYTYTSNCRQDLACHRFP
jgi:hypothetical protein